LKGNHNARIAIEITYEPNELILGDIDVENLIMNIEFSVFVEAAQIKTKYEVEKRGRVILYEPILIDTIGKEINIKVIQVNA